jgi:hypothetical protein
MTDYCYLSDHNSVRQSNWPEALAFSGHNLCERMILLPEDLVI